MNGQMAQARANAERKLQRIISREGDYGGARCEPWYFEQLVQEASREIRFAELTQASAYKAGEKERQLTSHNVSRHVYDTSTKVYPYCITGNSNLQ